MIIASDIINLALVCEDDPEGYDGYDCTYNYCDEPRDWYAGDRWYDKWRESCKKKCGICPSKSTSWTVQNYKSTEKIVKCNRDCVIEYKNVCSSWGLECMDCMGSL